MYLAIGSVFSMEEEKVTQEFESLVHYSINVYMKDSAFEAGAIS